MQDELGRSRSIRIEGIETPYYIEYSLDEGETCSLSASLGGIVSVRRERFRLPAVKVRVGDYKFDNTNYVGSYQPSVGTAFPLDDLYGVVRRTLWLGTDRAYKSAVETLSRKRAALRNVEVSEPIDDFARAEAFEYVKDGERLVVDEDGWRSRVRALSALFVAHPGLRISGVEFEAIQGIHNFVNTEGFRVRYPERLVFVRARAAAQASDGMSVHDAVVFHARGFEGLPTDAQMTRAVERLATDTEALARAPKGDDYSGPVLFEGAAAAQLFAEVLGRNFALARRPVTEPGRPGIFPSSELEGRQGARILPEFFDVVDDPTQAEWRGRPLFGWYPVDREGIAPRPVALVEKGVLKNFLLTRQPMRGYSGSNGHARLPGSFGANTAAPGNLFVRARETVPASSLKTRLLELCALRGKPYGYLVRKMDFPSSASYEEVRRVLTGSAQSSGARPVSKPVLLYRVYRDGREELVRGLLFRGLNVRSFKDVLAAGDDENLLEFLNNLAPFALMGAGGYAAETSVVAPSVLIDDLELHPIQEELPKPPIVPAPL